MSRLVIISMVLLLAGCATGSSGTTGPSVDVSGTWNGTYTGLGSTSYNMSFIATLEQKGNVVTGTISGAQFTSYNGAIHGTVSGNTFTWRQAMGAGSGHVTVSGNEMSGTGTTAAAGLTGRVTLRRAQ